MTLSGGAEDAQFALPSAEEAERWEQLLPGSPERLIGIMEALSIVRIANDKEEREADRNVALVSLFLAFILALTLVIAAIVFFALGNNIAGGLLLGVPATGVAVSFIPKAIAGRKDDE